jgi:glyoxylase-like metal-dependent hydrolase (beta-lactamase superfamily II)
LKLFPEGIAVRPIAAYGHTPGHTLYLLSSGGERLLIWGDLTHAMAVQMPFPQVAVTYDVDSEQAVASRKTVLEFVVKNKIPVAGMHIAYPGMGVVSANSAKNPPENSVYRFTPF